MFIFLVPITFAGIYGVMNSMFASNVVDRVFETRSGQTKDNTVGICCFSAKHEVLRIKNKHWLALNQDNVSDWSDISIRGLFVQCASTIKTPTKLRLRVIVRNTSFNNISAKSRLSILLVEKTQ